MAKKNKQSQIAKDIEAYVDRKIAEENIEDILGERFSRYSKYIILDRALPDARDGLKPVQRRILYAMYKLGMFQNKPYRKSARIVGEVIGKYHPHGDTSVYDAMIHMSQPFNNLLPLIDVHGNNGSIDGDGAAAMRYTEARLSKYAEYLLQDLNKKTVGFVPNFDDEELEPVVLPGKFPNLLVNGGAGIAEGYATNIPPHNIDEVINASLYRLEHPDCSLDDLLKIVKGPDFPGGAIIEGLDGIKEAYKNGRGKVLVKSKIHDETAKNGNPLLIVTEIPYNVNKAALVKQMVEVAEKKNLDGVVDIRDESDREGMRIAIELKPDANKEVIKNFFFKYSQLASNFSFNMTVIIEKRPMTVGLIPLIDAFLNHQKDVLYNRSNYEMVQATRRLEIVDGLISMTSILDAVIQTIRSSKDKKDVKENLIAQYAFTEAQAEAIATLQLYRLSNTDIVALENEKTDLNDKVAYLNNILSNETALNNLVQEELGETLKALSTPRKTEIVAEMQEIDISQEEILAKEPNIVYATRDGYLKRLTPKNDAIEDENVVKEGDAIIATYHLTNLDTILFFTNLGNYVYLPVRNIPECKHKDIGYNISTLTSISASERIIYQMAASNFKDDEYILFTTKNGLVKRTPLSQLYAQRYSKALQATKLRDGDEVLSVCPQTTDSQFAIFITQKGLFTKYDLNEISVMAVASYGMIGVTLPKGSENDKVIAGFLCNENDTVVLLTSKQMKNLKVENFMTSKRTYTAKPIIEEGKTPSEMLAAQPFSPALINENPIVYLYGTGGHIPLTLVDIGLVKGHKVKHDMTVIKKPQYYIISKKTDLNS